LGTQRKKQSAYFSATTVLTNLGQKWRTYVYEATSKCPKNGTQFVILYGFRGCQFPHLGQTTADNSPESDWTFVCVKRNVSGHGHLIGCLWWMTWKSPASGHFRLFPRSSALDICFLPSNSGQFRKGRETEVKDGNVCVPIYEFADGGFAWMPRSARLGNGSLGCLRGSAARKSRG
jgi:hypothetical protein